MPRGSAIETAYPALNDTYRARRHHWRPYQSEEGQGTWGDWYFNNHSPLTAGYERLKKKLLELSKQGTRAEFAFWRTVLRSKQADQGGLRTALDRIRNLCKEFGLLESVYPGELEIYHYMWRRQKALKWLVFLTELQLPDKRVHLTATNLIPAYQQLKQQLKKDNLGLRDIGTSERKIRAICRTIALKEAKERYVAMQARKPPRRHGRDLEVDMDRVTKYRRENLTKLLRQYGIRWKELG
jgi:hypothetical protein